MNTEKVKEITDTFTTHIFCTDTHYSLLEEWWRKQKKTPPAPEMLSDTGIVVCDEIPLAMGFMYFSNSGLGQLGFVCANPEIGPRRKLTALLFLIETGMKVFAQSKGIKYVHTYSDEPGLTKAYVANGFNLLSQHDVLIQKIGGINGH